MIGDLIAMSVVELPRLALRFAIREVEGVGRGRKLYSLDHSDLFVCEDAAGLRLAEKFSACLQHGLLMQDHFDQYCLLVPNYSISRVSVRSCPFGSPLVSDRSEKAWRDRVRTGYYLYPLHPSGSFMVMSSFAAAMYMVLLRLLRRDYEG